VISAGTKSQVLWGDGNWIFLDIGFSSARPTCGFAFGDEDPSCLSFGATKTQVIERIRGCSDQVNLVIEAPLSVCFDAVGNPKGRRIERQERQVRYWYFGVGCMVMTAALYVLRGIHDAQLNPDLHLFEGFVSFKQAKGASDHLWDVQAMRDIVRNSQARQDSIFSPSDLRIDAHDLLQSAFRVSGMDLGVPAVIMGKQKAQ
jgi:hypothetical protein